MYRALRAELTQNSALSDPVPRVIRRLRALTVVDAFKREALAIDVGQGIKGEQVVGTDLVDPRCPRIIRVENGPAFVSKALDRAAYDDGITLDLSRPGKPTDNAFVESFNGRLRGGCLNTHRLVSLEDAEAIGRAVVLIVAPPI